MTMGNIIENRRKELNMTQEQLAEALGTTKATVSRWESGGIRKMKQPMIIALAKTLQVDPLLFVQQEEVLLPEEYDVISAYRMADDLTKAAVRKLLEIKG